MFIIVVLGTAWSQSESVQTSAGSEVQGSIPQVGSQPDTAPLPAETSTASVTDQSTVIPRTGPTRSYLLAGIHISEGADSNPAGIVGSSTQLSSTTNILGSIDLLKLRRHSETAIDYVGGNTVYSNYAGPGIHNQQVQEVDAKQRIQWRRWELTVRNSFSDLRGGNFGSAPFGGASAHDLRFTAVGAASPVIARPSDFFGASQFGGPGQESSITNVSVADLTKALAARSSAFLAGAYSITDYFGSGVNARQISAQAGYNYQLNRRDEMGVEYGYQSFQFPQSGVANVITHSAQLVYRHKISSRLDVALGGGPEFARLDDGVAGSAWHFNATVQSSLGYRLERSSLNLSYDRLVTAGSGFFAGGNSDVVRFSVSRAIFRFWQTALDAGYARVTSLEPSSTQTYGASYQYGFAGAAIQRQLGSRLHAFASYQFNNESLNSSFCGAAICNSGTERRHVVVLGIDWQIRPFRLE